MLEHYSFITHDRSGYPLVTASEVTIPLPYDVDDANKVIYLSSHQLDPYGPQVTGPGSIYLQHGNLQIHANPVHNLGYTITVLPSQAAVQQAGNVRPLVAAAPAAPPPAPAPQPVTADTAENGDAGTTPGKDVVLVLGALALGLFLATR